MVRWAKQPRAGRPTGCRSPRTPTILVSLSELPDCGFMSRLTAIFLLGAASLLVAADSLPGLMSGLQVGEKVPTFYVRAITGPLQGRSVCYVCRNGDRPVVMIFVRELSPELRKLLKQVDELVDAHRADGLRSFGVFLAADGKALLPAVQTLAFDEKLNLPLTVSAAAEDRTARPTHPVDASFSVILYRDQKVAANFTYRAGELTEEELTRLQSAIVRLAKGE